MERHFRIGDFSFRLIHPDCITPPENFLLFQADVTPEYTYTMEFSDSFPLPEGEPISRNPDLLVYRRGGLETRYIGLKGSQGAYGCYVEESPCSARVYIAPNLDSLHIDPVFCSLLALERRLIEKSSLILHSAYLDHEGRAILFSAPSGVGKSTQAGLWEQYRGGKTVNGDRCLLQKIGGKWFARGWPVCGSSGICKNQDTPIRALVTLSQAPADTVSKVPPSRAFSMLYSQITVNYWNREAQAKAMDLLERLVSEVSVYHLSCTISENAVQTLEQVLE